MQEFRRRFGRRLEACGTIPDLAFRSGWGKLGGVRFLRLQPGESKRYLLAIVAGLLMACSFPKIGLSGLAWIAPGLMLAAAWGRRVGRLSGLGMWRGWRISSRGFTGCC